MFIKPLVFLASVCTLKIIEIVGKFVFKIITLIFYLQSGVCMYIKNYRNCSKVSCKFTILSNLYYITISYEI